MSIALFCVSLARSQDTNRNYVVSKSYLDDSASGYTTSVQYFDGLGRKTQAATNEIGTNNQYVYTFTQYDKCGRDSVVWLPRSGSTTPGYISDFVSDTNAPYSDEDYPFSITTYDGISRPVETTTPGSEWHLNDKAKRWQYYTNRNDEEEIKRYSTDSKDNEVVIDNGFYPEFSLFKEESLDEDNHTIIQYKNLRGDLVMESNNGMDTYYVYDIYSNLRFVLPPNCPSISTSDLHKYAYIYKYDNMNRCIEKKLPGCDPSIFVYDIRDRLVISQDPLLCEKGLYRFMLYDELGRVAIQGTTTNYSATNTNAFLAFRVISSGAGHYDSGYNIPSMLFPNGINLEIVNYYDDYSFFDHFMPSGNNLISNLRNDNYIPVNDGNRRFSKGSLTGQIVATSDGNYLFNTFYYNNKGKVVDERHSTLDGKVYKVFTDYSFTDKPTQVTKVIPHSDSNTSTSTIITSFEYNQHNDQLQSTKVKLGTNGTEHVVSDLTYDDLGHIASESRPDINETINYYYDLHGWTDSIAGRYFTEHLYYAGDTGTPCYNGDISVQEWKASDDSLRVYRFTYNDRDMLKDAVYDNLSAGDSHHGRYDERSITYNSNGAMTKLFRKGMRNNESFGYIDLLTFAYDGNQLQRVNDGISATLSRNGAFEYQNNNRSGNDFEYNTAGMLVKDRDKGIERIVYNNIGLVDSIIFESGAKVAYTYSMSGEKLRVRHYAAPETMVSTQPSDNGFVPYLPGGSLVSYDEETYYGTDVVESNSFGGLMRTLPSYKYYFGNGYMSFSSRFMPLQSTFYYYSKDHLGNIRSVVKANANGTGTEQQVTHYYPFGGIIADISSGTSVQNRLYNGKELDTSNNLWWYDYGARQYDPTAPRFTTPDPLAEKYYGWNMYGYCVNNPIRFIDPDGRDWIMAQYESDLFVYFDSTISSQNDIYDKYGKETSIKYVGSFGTINQKQENGESKRIYSLNEDGSYDLLINEQRENLYVGNDTNVENVMSNIYGNYLGPNNPQKDDADYYAVPPIDDLDYAAFVHDKMYDKNNAHGANGAFLNTSVGNADTSLAGSAANSLWNARPYSKKATMSFLTGTLFSAIAFYKNIINAF